VTVTLGITPLINVRVLSPTVLIADVPMSMTLGTYNVTVTNPTGESGMLTNAFTIIPFRTAEGVTIYDTLDSPTAGIDVDASGNVWTTGGHGPGPECVITKLDPTLAASGTTQGVERYLMISQPTAPADLMVHPDGTVWFAESYYSGDKVGRLNPTLAVSGTTNGMSEYHLPGWCWEHVGDLSVDSRGDVWFSDAPADIIGKVDLALAQSGTSNGVTGYPVPGAGCWPSDRGAVYVHVAHDDTVWAMTWDNSALLRLNPNQAQPGTSNGYTEYPLPPTSYAQTAPDWSGYGFGEIAEDSQHYIWVAMYNHNKLVKIVPSELVPGTSQGMYEYIVPTAHLGPFKVAVDSNDNIWYTGWRSGKVGMLDVSKAISGTSRGFSEYVISDDGIDDPYGLAIDANDNLWMSAWDNGRIIKFTPPLLSVILTQSTTPAIAAPDEYLTYTLSIRNSGAAKLITLTQAIPANTTYKAGSAQSTPPGVDDSNGIAWYGTLGTSQSALVTFTVRLALTTSHGSTIVATAFLSDGIESHSQTITTPVEATYGLCADYYTQGTLDYLFRVEGEGPIAHGYPARYQNTDRLWADRWDGWDTSFFETLHGYFVPAVTGYYTIGLGADDYISVTIEGLTSCLVDDYGGGSCENKVYLKAGKAYTLTMDGYMSRWGSNGINFWYRIGPGWIAEGGVIIIPKTEFRSCHWTPPFQVSTNNPPNAAIAVAPTANISVTFNRPISPTTVTSRTFTVRGNQTGDYAGAYTVLSNTVTFDPARNFRPGEEIAVNLSSGIRSTDGITLTPYTWQFQAAVLGGTGIFTDSGQRLSSANTADVKLGDLDGDGDLDAFIGNVWTHIPNEVWFNDGLGHFNDSGQRLGNATTESVALGDLDGDGDLDVFAASTNFEPHEVWLNDGTGHFSDSGQRLGNSYYSTFVALGDVDGDGDLDAFIGNGAGSYEQPNQVWLNDGTGNFTDSGQRLGSSTTYDVALGDLDGDGDLDAFIANIGLGYSGAPNEIWLNDGVGVFADSGQRLGNSARGASQKFLGYT
jgi:uncharacterized repeat protein (TIGR01451 family)